MKKIFALFLAVLMLFSLSACSGGIKGADAKEYINGFLSAIEDRDFALAQTFAHPDFNEDFSTYFSNAEESYNVDFSNIEIEKYTGFNSAYYDSTVGGSLYGLDMRLDVSGKPLYMEIQIIKNDNGYGINYVNVYP